MSQRAIGNVVGVLLIVLGIYQHFSGSVVVPIPSPIPSPKPGSWVVLVEETEDRTSDVAKLMADGAWMASLESRQLKFRLYDDDQPEAASYVPIANRTGLPAVVVVAPDGAVLGSFKLPADRPELDRLIKEATGL